jgi:hypothetical protein
MYGAADFLGGLAARRTNTVAVVVVSQSSRMVVLALMLPLLPAASPVMRDLIWGAVAGIAVGTGLVLLYALTLSNLIGALALQIVQHLRAVESRGDDLAHDQRDVLLREILRTVTGKRDLDPVAFELPMARLLAMRFAEPVGQQPAFHGAARDFSRHLHPPSSIS